MMFHNDNKGGGFVPLTIINLVLLIIMDPYLFSTYDMWNYLIGASPIIFFKAPYN